MSAEQESRAAGCYCVDFLADIVWKSSAAGRLRIPDSGRHIGDMLRGRCLEFGWSCDMCVKAEMW